MSEEIKPTTEVKTDELKAKSVIFKSLKVGQLFYMRDEKNKPGEQQFIKQTKTAYMQTGCSSIITLTECEPKTKVSIFYNIRDFNKKKPA